MPNILAHCGVQGALTHALIFMGHAAPLDACARPDSLAQTRLGLAAVCLTAYLVLPLVLWHGPYAADNYFIKTLRERHARAGRYIEMDRANYVSHAEEASMFSLVGEAIRVQGPPQDHTAKISIEGTFLDAETVRIENIHLHWPWFRDGSSYIGLMWLGVLWLKSWWQPRLLVGRYT
jgi:hypothetical protein